MRFVFRLLGLKRYQCHRIRIESDISFAGCCEGFPSCRFWHLLGARVHVDTSLLAEKLKYVRMGLLHLVCIPFKTVNNSPGNCLKGLEGIKRQPHRTYFDFSAIFEQERCEMGPFIMQTSFFIQENLHPMHCYAATPWNNRSKGLLTACFARHLGSESYRLSQSALCAR